MTRALGHQYSFRRKQGASHEIVTHTTVPRRVGSTIPHTASLATSLCANHTYAACGNRGQTGLQIEQQIQKHATVILPSPVADRLRKPAQLLRAEPPYLNSTRTIQGIPTHGPIFRKPIQPPCRALSNPLTPPPPRILCILHTLHSCLLHSENDSL